MERDYPVGHPAASDYRGEPYTPPRAPFSEDFAPGHPARDGKNISALDSPDGMRAAHNEHRQNLAELAAIGSLRPLIDDQTGQPIPLSPYQLAHVYAVRKGLSPENANDVTRTFHLDPMPERPATPEARALSGIEQCTLYLIKLGYTPERAKELLDKYGEPEVRGDMLADVGR